MPKEPIQPQYAPSRSMAQFVLRMPEGLRNQVKLAAGASRRSMNAEMIRYIEQGLIQSNQHEVRTQ